MTPDPIEQRDAGNAGHPRSSSANLQKRIMRVFVLVLSLLGLTMYAYVRSTFLGETDWRVFWGYEAVIPVSLVFGIVVQALKKRPKL